jgi:predicted methyltransferase
MEETMISLHRLIAATLLLGFAVLGFGADAPVPDFKALVDSPQRSDADRQTDVRRKPAELLAFYGVRPGMKVLDLAAATGYNTELLARAVGPNGKVYGQNTQDMVDTMVKDRFDQRVKRSGLANMVHVVRPFEDPLPPDVRNIDLVTIDFSYHDTAYMGVDRAKMNRAVFNVLKPGGVYIIADHSARAGVGVNDTKTLHRIDEALVKREVEAAGFRLAAEGDFLRNPKDPRDKPVFKPDQPNDEFVLKFVKP